MAMYWWGPPVIVRASPSNQTRRIPMPGGGTAKNAGGGKNGAPTKESPVKSNLAEVVSKMDALLTPKNLKLDADEKKSLLDELDDKGLIDHDLWCIDGTVIRASRAAAGAGKKGGRLKAAGRPQDDANARAS